VIPTKTNRIEETIMVMVKVFTGMESGKAGDIDVAATESAESYWNQLDIEKDESDI